MRPGLGEAGCEVEVGIGAISVGGVGMETGVEMGVRTEGGEVAGTGGVLYTTETGAGGTHSSVWIKRVVGSENWSKGGWTR